MAGPNGSRPPHVTDDLLREILLPRLEGVKKQHGYWMARCPVHDDQQASLSLKQGNERPVIMNCHAGCSNDDILVAVGLTWADLQGDEPAPRNRPVVVATYTYEDEQGTALFYTERRMPKDFRQYQVQDGEKVWNLHGVRRVIYRLPRVLAAVEAGSAIFVTEGEKDVHALEAAGETATCNPMGAGKWLPEYAEFLRGAVVHIVADRDAPGQEHAKQVASTLEGVAAAVEIVQALTGKDAYDHLAAGHTVAEFLPFSEVDPTDAPLLGRILPGTFLLDQPPVPPAVWGVGDSILWAEDEALVIAGPDGTGKTTLAGELVKARLSGGQVLDLPVAAGKRRVLYLAMDRPSQSARALGRLFSVEDKAVLEDRLRIWKGPPPKDLARDPELLIHLCELADADTLFVDSLKDAVMRLSEDDAGAMWNRARQMVIMTGVQVCELHHTRKTGQGTDRIPARLDDLYGSRWITAGAGSVVCLWGNAGDLTVQFRHLKPVVVRAGPKTLIIDPETHRVTGGGNIDWVQQAMLRKGGLTVHIAACMHAGSDDPSDAIVARVRRELDRLVSEQRLYREDGPGDGSVGRPPAVYKPGLRSL
jgi:hypothetical protein